MTAFPRKPSGEAGRGTRVVVELPAVATEAGVVQTSAAVKESEP